MSKGQIIVLIVVVIIIILVGWALFRNYPGSSTASLTQFATPTPNPNVFDIQGMKVEILQQGTGEQLKNGDTATVNYVGTLQNGTKFDSSYDRNQPFSFTIGANQVIKGWDLGVAGMRVGEKRRLTIPPELGYGSQAVGNVIPPNSTLIFEVELLGINTALGK